MNALTRPEPTITPNATQATPTLRPYQEASVAAIRAAYVSHRRVLFVLPTGGGKTVIFSFITSAAMGLGHRVIVLAHRAEIVDQISEALATWGVPHGRIQPGFPMTDDLVQVGMVQTVAHRLDAIPAPELLVIDEAHHCVATTYSRNHRRLVECMGSWRHRDTRTP